MIYGEFTTPILKNTHFKKKWFKIRGKKTRLYIFLNDHALDKIIDTELFSNPYSDHRGVQLNIKSSDTQRGPGYYKFNNLLLKDSSFVSSMNSTIDDFSTANLGEDPE